MSDSFITFSDKELNFFQDTEFLLAKSSINEKVFSLLVAAETSLKAIVKQKLYSFPKGTFTKAGKISKGENYRQLPYLILDYPRLFSQQSILAFRTMFWWGNEFSATLHLQGDALETVRPALLKNHQNLVNHHVYFCIHPSPWEYYFNDDNYKSIEELYAEELTNYLKVKPFLKFSRQLPLSQWHQLIPFVTDTFQLFFNALNTED